MVDLITENLDLWSSAYIAKKTAGRGSSTRSDAYGIQKLRELILELAVRGKLVPQDPNDEPASVLLEKIALEKERLVEEGKIKKQKPLPSICDKEKPFEIPDGWSIERFGNISLIERGGSPRPIQSFLTDDPDGLNWIKIGDTDIGGKYISSTAEKIIKEGLVKTRMVYPGDFLLTNSMSFGRPYITRIEGCIHDGWLRISPAKEINKDYLFWLLSSPYIVNAFKKSAAGAVVQNLNSDKVREVIILLPPDKEQYRIITKVNELMELCDQLEAQQNDSIEVHQTLVEVLLNTLTLAKDAQEFQESWAGIAEHFDILFISEQSIETLKQTILQLAVMGKLVPQDPNDEPASFLLEKIAQEKERLIKEGKIKKQTKLPKVSEDEKLFDLPRGWAWSRLIEYYDVRDGTHDSPKAQPFGFPLVTSKNLYTGKLDLTDVNYISEEDHQKIIQRSKVDKGDILFAMIGSIGNPVIVDTDEEFSIKNVALFKYYSQDWSVPRYLQIFLELASNELKAKAAGGVQSFVSLGTLRSYVMAIPPLLEQHRIVAKVDELMTLCDSLKQQLEAAQTTQIHLADAIVEQAVK